jgi:hypothetical protein
MPMRTELPVRTTRWSEDPRQSSRFSSIRDDSNRDLPALVVFGVCALIAAIGLMATVYAAYNYPTFGAAVVLLGQY